ncbi:hypothetical protein [Actinoplanes sp. NPDC051494]|uniref:hypothetical protein n=1 Tax=Actinoplanes sp. NPDC051494 TaxID=3363907 RepID=UPI0037904241
MTTVMGWADGERERWRSRAGALEHGREQPDWVTAATGADRFLDLSMPQVSWLVAKGPEASARALLATTPRRHPQQVDVGRVAVARIELDALAYALSEAGENADRLGFLVLPFRGPEAAALVAGWLRHLGSARLWARTWLGRHPEAGAHALIPVAIGKPGKARQNADTPQPPRPGQAARKRKAAPVWATPERLPEVTWARGGVLPEDEVVRLIDVLTRSRLDAAPEPAPGDPDGELPLVVESSAAAQPMVCAPVLRRRGCSRSATRRAWRRSGGHCWTSGSPTTCRRRRRGWCWRRPTSATTPRWTSWHRM